MTKKNTTFALSEKLTKVATNYSIKQATIFNTASSPLRKEKAKARKEALERLNVKVSANGLVSHVADNAFASLLSKSELRSDAEIAYVMNADLEACGKELRKKLDKIADERKKKAEAKAKSEKEAQEKAERRRIAMEALNAKLANGDKAATDLLRLVEQACGVGVGGLV